MSRMQGRATRLTRRRVIALALTAMAALAWWFTLAPRTVGGPLSAVVVNGTSMQPLFHTGDVVVVRRHSSYHVCEIVAAKVDGGEVIHRLVAGNATTGWRTQGINRRSMDSWVIPNDHILGAKWLFLRHAGSWTTWVRQPEGAGCIAAALAFLCAVAPGRRRRSRKHRTMEQSMKQMKQAVAESDNAAQRWLPRLPMRLEPAALGASSLGTMALGLMVLTWWLPGDALELVPRPAMTAVVGATVLLAVATAFVGLLVARVYRGFGGTPEERAWARLRDRAVPVRSVTIAGSLVVLGSARELRRISDLSVAPIVHEVTPLGHRYAVIDETTTYLYIVGGPRGHDDWVVDLTSRSITLPDAEPARVIDLRV